MPSELIPHKQPTPIVIAHRGASGLRPEHTLASYRLAIEQGADFIELDLVMSRDGVPVVRHESEIGGTTDIADHALFSDRFTRKCVDGQEIRGWFTEDLSLDDLKALRARERLPDLRVANRTYDGEEAIPTLDEVITFVQAEEARLGRVVGLYIETKHPSYFEELGLPMLDTVVGILEHHGRVGAGAPVFLQSFEVDSLKQLRRLTDTRLIQLIDASGAPFDRVRAGDPMAFRDMIQPAGLARVAGYADGIGPHKALIRPRDEVSDDLLGATSLVADAHAAGLLVHPFTFRDENTFLPVSFRRGTEPAASGDGAAEILAFLATGIDGFFTDFPATGRRAVDTFAGSTGVGRSAGPS